MQPRLSLKRNAAMTLFEVGVVVAVVMILALVLLPVIQAPHKRASKVGCTNLLKQIGLAYKVWAGDNGDVLPMGISVSNGGSMELAATGNVLATFLVMSNELSTPKILFCPSDAGRSWATSFGTLANSNISYFVGLGFTNDANPQIILSGDSSFGLGGTPAKPGLAAFGTNDPVFWSPSIRHMKSGNLGLNDGSVLSTTSSSLRSYLQQTGLATNRFAIP